MARRDLHLRSRPRWVSLSKALDSWRSGSGVVVAASLRLRSPLSTSSAAASVHRKALCHNGPGPIHSVGEAASRSGKPPVNPSRSLEAF